VHDDYQERAARVNTVHVIKTEDMSLYWKFDPHNFYGGQYSPVYDDLQYKINHIQFRNNSNELAIGPVFNSTANAFKTFSIFDLNNKKLLLDLSMKDKLNNEYFVSLLPSIELLFFNTNHNKFLLPVTQHSFSGNAGGSHCIY